MHELTVCHSIIKTLEGQAKIQAFTKIKTIWLEIGKLTCIELDALQFSFPIVAKDSIAETASLKIKPVAGLAFCQNCQIQMHINNHHYWLNNTL